MVFESTFPSSIPDAKYKESLSLFYWHQLDKFAQKTLFVDYASQREWTGREIKQAAIKIANFLLKELKLQPNDTCVIFHPNSDLTHLAALGALFAGGCVCAGAVEDPQPEHEYMLQLMRPHVVMADGRLYKELIEIRERLKASFAIIVLNDNQPNMLTPNGEPKLGLHKHILNNCLPSNQLDLSSTNNLPILVGPNDPAYVLLTSGSTGQPKPVARSHKNSLYVTHCLDTCPELWVLSERSVFAGHLPLDHGTGTFSIKMCLSKGFKMIIMENYYFDMLLEAVNRYQITDCILGSALLHNLMVKMLENKELCEQFQLNSMENFISVGSPIASHEIAVKFMEKYPNCSVRQSLGMTECGFVVLVKRADCLISEEPVGWLLPNLKLKLMELENNLLISSNKENNSPEEEEEGATRRQPVERKEVKEREQSGELYLSGPTISPGYMGGDKYAEQQKLAFMEDGFYRTFDVAFITSEGQICMRGRCNDILCLGDGWKVLPAEIERVLVRHEGILEAAVVGIPNPALPSCHAPRAYVVPADGWKEGKLTPEEVVKFAERHLSEPKHLVGGVKIVDELPRITLGKVNKRALRQADGL